jgi:PsbP
MYKYYRLYYKLTCIAYFIDKIFHRATQSKRFIYSIMSLLFLLITTCTYLMTQRNHAVASFTLMIQSLSNNRMQRCFSQRKPNHTTRSFLSSQPLNNSQDQDTWNFDRINTRRRDIVKIATSAIVSVGALPLPPAWGGVSTNELFTDGVFVSRTDSFGYQFTPPPVGFGEGPEQKPLKTHLDEYNFKSKIQSGYQYGITVDPVRINSLNEFGTPEQIAAKVVLAEVNRDGVFDVKLMEDPITASGADDENSASSFVQLNYISSGKRGKKRFIAKFYIHKQKLYVLTAQCKEENYDEVQSSEILEAVKSFRVI